MPNIAITVGLILTLVGPLGYALSSADKSLTAFIPSAFGIVILVCGVIARAEKARKHAIHAALAIALLAVLGTAGRAVPAYIQLLSGEEVKLPLALAMQSIVLVVCIVFIVLGVRSFIAARKARTAAATA